MRIQLKKYVHIYYNIFIHIKLTKIYKKHRDKRYTINNILQEQILTIFNTAILFLKEIIIFYIKKSIRKLNRKEINITIDEDKLKL